VPRRAGPWPHAMWQRAPAGLGLGSELGARRETAPTSGARWSAGEREEGAGAGGLGRERGVGCARGKKKKGGEKAAAGLGRAGSWARAGRGGEEKRRKEEGHEPGCWGGREGKKVRREGGRLGSAQRREERGKREKKQNKCF
jgi:hypothetical protein